MSLNCPIAGTLVNVTPRSGQSLLESGRPYIRCSERDCQYVDLNEPPCPLRPAMFDGQPCDAELLAHLGEPAAGQAICYGCLVEKLAVSHDAIRRAAWRLKDARGARIGAARCTVCAARRVTIAIAGDAGTAHAAERPPATPHASVGDAGRRLVTAIEGQGTCAGCLAFATALPLAEVRRLAVHLERDGAVVRKAALCSGCGREESVIAASDGRGATPGGAW